MTDKPKLTLVETLPSADQPDIASVIDVLQRALADAKEGNVLACAIALVGPKDRLGYYSSSSPRYLSSLLSSVNLTNWRLCEEFWHDKEVDTEEFPEPPNQAG
jgi:hypothetical protein